eukprot:TRINITY_DN25352_c0_g1_i1.p1 TRINITY_DN25352_c0_g1~~TRINITY_DN25352_c0_g1_i1.p1  ORF type:complete len:586 (-),score=123.73 TRINITY_DN25352_c0_g1_i1:21-1778(-)
MPPHVPKEAGGKWIEAFVDPLASVSAYSGLLCLADIDGDGSAELIIADLSQKVKIYKGTRMFQEFPLLDVPTAAVTYHMEDRETPVLAIAAGPSIYVFKNLQPLYKFTLPDSQLDPGEADIWASLKEGRIDAETVQNQLLALKDTPPSAGESSGRLLTTQAHTICATSNVDELNEMVAHFKETTIALPSSIVAMSSLYRTMDDEMSQGMLVLGTETREILILNPTAANMVVKVKLPSPAVQIEVIGKFTVEYRIAVACRDGRVRMIRNGSLVNTIIDLETHPVGMVLLERHIYLSCMNKNLQCFTSKAKKSFSKKLPGTVTCMCKLFHAARRVNLVVVALDTREVMVFKEEGVVSVFIAKDVVVSMAYGKYGREDGALALALAGGGLEVRFLPRRTNLDDSVTNNGPPPEQDIPLSVPKKTQLWVDQQEREKQVGEEMHRLFQRDLYRLRLNTARAYVKTITSTMGPSSIAGKSSVKVSASVMGLGSPNFIVTLSVENTSKKGLEGLTVSTSADVDLYSISNPHFSVPYLVPCVPLKFNITVKCLPTAAGRVGDIVRIMVGSAASHVPLVTAMAQLPTPSLDVEA